VNYSCPLIKIFIDIINERRNDKQIPYSNVIVRNIYLKGWFKLSEW
jgi:hypothetical protein